VQINDELKKKEEKYTILKKFIQENQYMPIKTLIERAQEEELQDDLLECSLKRLFKFFQN
jgi:hypothetical protein